MSKPPRLHTLRPRVATMGDRISIVRPGMRKAGDRTGQGLYTYRWKQESKAFLRAHPLCQCPDCDDGRKRVTMATVVDHKIPHRGDVELFWNRDNWQAMAKPCHDKKTATEDGGFGNV